jgi:hypothetical protein
MNDTMMTFDEWMHEVDRELRKLCGLDHRCISDQPWADWHADEMAPTEAVEMALKDEGFPFDE